ncbi:MULTISPECIES: sigma-70 family RNA polymerase sigma factor [Calothrix]|uniref:Sigma-70 family RNA polymerase sigma factor n=2 Tax=Calothrix TaxID=1186 RepID=A0ABR8A719_9CYAN|nr:MULTISPECIES: sigma-70 family RNA polymerase sigma factor [Calothrix]MBD2195807.1 sigma-70 family RNA polymerase sigma factor [Calothrix parietina FACHB-288]MBD2226444.1 sigma-70 family RNA polymerase sigma factor [Calothrix anomala FACHB-343]
MRPRLEIIEIFSTFAQLEADRFSKWLTEVKLRRSMQNNLAEIANNQDQANKFTENFWAFYWYKIWRSNSHLSNLAKAHLSAYLQETCYWAAEKAIAKFAVFQYGLADYFQMGIAELETILQGYNPDKSTALKTYATIAFPSRLKDLLRQRKEADICTNWGLLRKVSKKVVLEALQNAGLSPTQVAQYRLAWTCFRMLYLQNQPGGIQKLPQPNRQLWENIAHLYNSERLSQLTFPTAECNWEMIAEWLNKTTIYVRNYLYPSVSSLYVYNQDEDSNSEFDIKDPTSESLLADILAQEEAQNRRNQISQMNDVLLSALEGLDSQSQRILELYYQQGMTQQQIIQELKISQPTVSRRLLKGRESLLKALIDWSQKAQNISVSSNQIKDMSAALEEWLRIYYAKSSFKASTV